MPRQRSSNSQLVGSWGPFSDLQRSSNAQLVGWGGPFSELCNDLGLDENVLVERPQSAARTIEMVIML